MVTPRRRILVLVALTAAGAVAAAVVVAVLVLSRVTQPTAQPTSPAATPTETIPSTASTPTPSSTPDAEVSPSPSRIVLGADGFVLESGKGSDAASFEFLWSDEPDEAVAALTRAFGFEPAIELKEGDGTHFPDYTVWRWSSFAFGSMVETPGNKTRDEYAGPAWVEYEANTVAGVELRAEFGLAIGTTAADARAAGPDDEYPLRDSTGVRFVFADDRSFVPEDGGRPQVSVVADADDADGTIVKIAYRSVPKL